MANRSDNTVGRLPCSVYHLAESVNWPSIQRHGLLSATALLDLAGGSRQERVTMEQQRVCSVILPNGLMIRDQKPMPPQALERCLSGMAASEWYLLLNRKVFFWFDIERLNRMRRACGPRSQVVMTVDLQRLLSRYAEQATLTPINTGNARRQPALRSWHSFVPYCEWLQSGWASETEALGTRARPRSHQPVELTIEYAVPDIMEFVTDIRHLGPDEVFCAPMLRSQQTSSSP